MKKGNLVNFYSTYEPFQKDYEPRNPGVIIASESARSFLNAAKNIDKGSAYVLWSNGDITKEHLTYLELLQEEQP